MSEQLAHGLFERIRFFVSESRGRTLRTVNEAMVVLYWNIGRMIVDDEQNGAARAAYGEAIIDDLAKRLTAEFGKGFDARNLRNMRAFFRSFPIRNSLRSELSWTHYRVLMRASTESARRWYMDEAANAGWSVRMLERQIGTRCYERLPRAGRQPLAPAASTVTPRPFVHGPGEAIKDPYVFEFLGVSTERLLERDLESALLDNLQAFLLELGRGFSFVARQHRVSTETSDFYVDLVFYHFRLKCFVLVDLKTGALTPQDIGQVDMYVRLFDAKMREPDDRPTIGLILCSHKDETIARYSVLSDKERLFASEYLLHLPSEDELRRELSREREAVLLHSAIDASDG